jgi:RNA polymerase-interacting CarD/CdnL/TRCF family regulator
MILHISVTKYTRKDVQEVMSFDLFRREEQSVLSLREKKCLDQAVNYLILNPEVATVTLTYRRE